MTYRGLDGKEILAIISFSIPSTENGFQSIPVSIIDTTELKQAEKKIEESAEILLKFQEVAQLGSYLFDIPSGIWTGSEVLDNIFGIDGSLKRSLDDWSSIVHPDWQNEMLDYLAHDVFEKRGRFDMDYKIVRENDGME